MDSARRLMDALGPGPGTPAAVVASPLTTVVLLLATVALWRLLGWSRQLRPGAKEASGVTQGAAPHGGGGGGGSSHRGYRVASVGVSGGSGLPQQRGALAEVVRSHNEHWQREMPKTGAVSLAQAHALQWGDDDLQASERSAQARDVRDEPRLPAYLWVGTTDEELAAAWQRVSRWLHASPKAPHPSSSDTSNTESSDSESVSSTDSESEVRPREVGREDPPHCAARRAERTQRLQALLPPEKRTDPAARRSLRALYSQLLWEAYWLRCPWIWVGPEAREMLGSFYQVDRWRRNRRIPKPGAVTKRRRERSDLEQSGAPPQFGNGWRLRHLAKIKVDLGCELGPQVDREYDKVVAEVQADIGEPAKPPALVSTQT